MDIDRLSSELKFANRIGQTLSTEEVISLQSSVLKLSHEYKFERYFFWGRVEGVSGNYYIVQAANFRNAHHFPQKKYFWRYPPIHAALKTSSSQSCLPRDLN
jgi:hypothetical protein